MLLEIPNELVRNIILKIEPKEIQTIDVWDSLGNIDSTLRDTAIKYLMRYGKKGGYNRKDLLKAVHYIVLLAHFTNYGGRGEDNGN